MIKALFLIFEPRVAWERIARARRGFAFILGFYLLPIIILTTAAEGWGLAHWGKWQPKFQKLKEARDFSMGNIVTLEVIQAALLLAMVFLSALLLLKISQTFQNQRSYREAFTTMAYGYSPLFLARLLDAGPMVHPATTWAIGVALTFWVLYQGIPHVMQPDPTHAFGVYLSSMFVVVLTSGLARIFTAMYLLGYVDFKHSWLTHKFPGLFQ
jgi:hypothetical protein